MPDFGMAKKLLNRAASGIDKAQVDIYQASAMSFMDPRFRPQEAVANRILCISCRASPLDSDVTEVDHVTTG